jgi:hypothetical protein
VWGSAVNIVVTFANVAAFLLLNFSVENFGGTGTDIFVSSILSGTIPSFGLVVIEGPPLF